MRFNATSVTLGVAFLCSALTPLAVGQPAKGPGQQKATKPAKNSPPNPPAEAGRTGKKGAPAVNQTKVQLQNDAAQLEKSHYYRFTLRIAESATHRQLQQPSSLRRNTASADVGSTFFVHISEIAFKWPSVKTGGAMTPAQNLAKYKHLVHAASVDGQYKGSESPMMALDNDPSTKWREWNLDRKFFIVVRLPLAAPASHFRFTTANDTPAGDPVSWTLEVSKNQQTWLTMHEQVNYSTPTARLTQTPWFEIKQVVESKSNIKNNITDSVPKHVPAAPSCRLSATCARGPPNKCDFTDKRNVLYKLCASCGQCDSGVGLPKEDKPEEDKPEALVDQKVIMKPAVNSKGHGTLDFVQIVLALVGSILLVIVVVSLSYVGYRGTCCVKCCRASAVRGPLVYDECENDIAEDNATGLTEEPQQFPQYWTNARNIKSSVAPLHEKDKERESNAFNQMVYVSRNHLPKFEELLSRSFRAKATQDRPCPKQIHPRTPGGCECVQVDGDPGLPEGYQVRRVIRVESSAMWRRYLHRRGKIQSKHATFPHLDPPTDTDAVANAYQDVFEPLDTNQNEVYIWHGTHVRKALAIAHDRFKIDMAGTTRGGTMYGPGVYLAESSTKADEYAIDEPGGCYDGVYAMLFCRACLGNFYYTTERDETAHERFSSGEFDSTCGDRLRSAGTFREFVIYDADQIYPEYIVLYSRRLKGSKAMHAAETELFHMEVPVYWRNCHLDPQHKAFHEHYVVRQTTVHALQRLVGSCSQSLKFTGTVIRARRVENSSTWIKYSSFKKSLHQTLQDESQHFVKVEKLVASQILTHAHLAHENSEGAISLSSLEERLNECMVWHGTDKESSEAIAHDDFRISWATKQHHGQRFGSGVYFSDCLDKSLTYTTPDKDGIRYVLLCRMLCGDMHYTEEESNTDATDIARSSSKTSVLANPSKKGPHEFIALSEGQVYPEYIVEIRIDELVVEPACDGIGKPASSRLTDYDESEI